LRAAVIHVLAFLSLGGHCATIMRTLQQTSKGECVITMFWLIPSNEYVLNLIKDLRRNQRLM
jgi:hypothetical protein